MPSYATKIILACLCAYALGELLRAIAALLTVIM
jgi:hypothetical protein